LYLHIWYFVTMFIGQKYLYGFEFFF
jgi:hypothetical protein